MVFFKLLGSIVGADEFMEAGDINADMKGLTIDEDFFTMTFKNHVPDILQVLAQFAILPKHCFEDADIRRIHADDYWLDPVVSGMYIVDEIVPNNYIRLVPNVKRNAKIAKIDEVIIHANDDMNFDLYATNNVDEILKYRANKNMKEHEIESLFYRYFVFNIDKDGEIDPLLDNVKFREAISYAIDRDTLLKDIYYNIGEVFDTATFLPDEYKVERGISYNPEKAKELLDEIDYDYERPFKIFYYYSDDISKRFMEAVRLQLEAVGLNVQIIDPNDTSLLVFNDYDLCLKGLSAFTYADWYLEYQSTNALNINLFGGDDKFDPLRKHLIITVFNFLKC